ncbi:ankyrin [Tribonema minus]|uniref:Ankyrin n=1 Tax=Tribonema minus TaxID=303371 RepID=A0A835ZCP7_9STRA|nr:ankyrin [Tribonema minus]
MLELCWSGGSERARKEMSRYGHAGAELTEDQLNDARAAFAGADAAAAGRISQAAARAALARLGLQLDDALFERLARARWAEYGRDDVSCEGFVALFALAAAPSRKYGAQLRKAAGRGDVAVVRELLMRGCGVNTADGNGMPALQHAAAAGLVDVAKLLKQCAGAELEVNTADNTGWTPLMTGAQLEDDTADNTGWTPLMTASAHGHAVFVRWLLDAGADARAASRAGRTALHAAASKGRDAVVRLLLAAGAAADARDAAGCAPLHLAALHAHVGAARALLEGGADGGAVDALGRGAADYLGPQAWRRLQDERGGNASWTRRK